MKDIVETYGGVILGVVLTAVLFTFACWAVQDDGLFGALTKTFARSTLGS